VSIELEPAIPILRIFDVARAREFYVDFLGFSWDWEHRFDAEAPLFVQVSRGKTLLFLSEHFGDGTPGSHLMIRMSGLAALHAELHAKDYRHARPGIQEQPWGWRDIAVTDPFGNRLTFSEECA
jgi:catechol 2,3-dioxygenase-like lactoylglutathione lyase family enzyme